MTKYYKLNIVFLSFCVFCCISPCSNVIAGNGNNQSKSDFSLVYSRWSMGITMGPNLSYRWLYDNPRYNSGEPDGSIIYTNPPLNFDDKKFIEYRNKYDKVRFGSFWGFNLECKLNNTFSLQFGSNLYGMGEKVYVPTITEQDFKNVFGGINDTIRNSFLVREFPLLLKFNIAPHSKYDLKLKNGFLNYKRHLIGMAGVGLAKPIINNSYYGSYIHFGEGNTMVNAIAGLGISQQLSNRFNLTLSSVFRYSFTPAMEYSSINEYYYTFGLEANLRYTFARRIKRDFILGKSFECFDPRSKPEKKIQGPKIFVGVISGLNISSYWGADATNEALGMYDPISKLYGDYTTAKGHWLPRVGPHFGLHIEYDFVGNAVAIATDLMYSQKGIVNKYTYTWDDDPSNGAYLNTIIKTKLDYFDMPLFFKFRIAPQNYILAGGMFSVFMGDKVLSYYQYFDNQSAIIGTSGTNYNYGTTTFKSYYHSSPNVFVKGFMLGYEINIDENVDLDFRLQQTDNLTMDYYKLFNITGQVSLIYMFSKRNKEIIDNK